jgi:putative membrane protein
VSRAPVVLVLDVGGTFAFYLTPLYSVAHQHPGVEAGLHLHMFLAGCLLSWYLVGRDPMPSRPSTRIRLLVLLGAVGSHDLLAKMMYAQGLPHHGGTADQLRLGAQIMFYGGDVVELALALALMSLWYNRTGRRLRQDQRRSCLIAATALNAPYSAPPTTATHGPATRNGSSSW